MDPNHQNQAVLNVASIVERSTVNGPGTRFVIWLQGCPIRCPGCINPEMWPIEPRHLIPVPAIAERIFSTTGIKGVTYTGGEPTLQAAELCMLSELIKQRGLSVVCYTGYTIEELRSRNDPWINRLLSLCDILIDGPFYQHEAAPLLWRGSKNQRIICLSERYRLPAEELSKPIREIELIMKSDSVLCTGFFTEKLMNKIKQQLGG